MERATHLRFAAAPAPAAGATDHVVRAEALGFDAALVACSDAPALLAATSRIELIADVRQGAVDGLLGGGRVALHVEDGAGTRTEELTALRGRPLDERPAIYAGGAAEPAAAAGDPDVWIIDGQPPREVRHRIAAARRRARPAGAPPLRFGLSALVVARETEAEAAIAMARAWERDDRAARPPAFGSARADLYRRFPHVGARGGTAAGLVGSYDTVAQRIRELRDLGIELLVVELLPAAGEADGGLAQFAEHVVPRVRRAEPVSWRTRALGARAAEVARPERMTMAV
jgi:hypothetical protein